MGKAAHCSEVDVAPVELVAQASKYARYCGGRDGKCTVPLEPVALVNLPRPRLPQPARLLVGAARGANATDESVLWLFRRRSGQAQEAAQSKDSACFTHRSQPCFSICQARRE